MARCHNGSNHMTDSVHNILEQRGSRYGRFIYVSAVYAKIREAMYSNGTDRYSPSQLHAIDAIAMKMARIATGDPDYLGNWVDIQGYAKLEQDVLEELKV
nr:MAG TPA: hypothetical protein [Caudoviricetes sp.]